MQLPCRSRTRCLGTILVGGLNAKLILPIIRWGDLAIDHRSAKYGAYTDSELAMDARAFAISKTESIQISP